MKKLKSMIIVKGHEEAAEEYARRCNCKYAAAIIMPDGEWSGNCDNNKLDLERDVKRNLKDGVYLKAKILKAD